MTRMHGSKELWLSALRADGPAMRVAFEEATTGPDGLTAAVPSCPGWSLLDLLHHMGAVYRGVRSHVSRGVTSRPEGYGEPDASPLPDAEAAIEWWTGEFDQLLTQLTALDPELPAWNWAPQPKQVSFWQRRIAHETAVHRWDAQTAIGRVEPIGATLAVDGINEVLDTRLPAGRRRGPTDRRGVVELIASDVDQEWMVRLRGEGVALLDTGTLLDHDDHHTRATARGTASDLNLALFGRIPFDLLDIAGDVTLLDALRTG